MTTQNNVLYREPVPLTREHHAGCRVAPVTDWRVAQGINAVPLASVEFPEAAREYPIAFVPTGQDAQGRLQVTPMALLGLRDGENLFVDEQGCWLGRYIPAFLRRYPFAYAATVDQQPALVVDAAWPGFGGEAGEVVLTESGEPTEHLKAVLAFMDTHERDMLRTRVLCDRLVAHDLLRSGEIRGRLPDGQPLNAGGFFMIDEARLATLPDDAVLELHRSGLMALVHIHLVSMGQVQVLAQRLGVR